jgi:glycosyltransferase involved in cell wall biosynthesis
MKDRPRVSVLVTAYRRPAFLAEAIESVLAQTFTDFEVIVLEDGSHDGEAIARSYGDRVRYVWQPNQGLAAARNAAAAMADGEWLAFLDDDDRWLPEKLAQQMALSRHVPGLDVIHTNSYALVDGGVRPRRGRRTPGEVPSGWVTAELFLGYFGLPSTLMVRRSLFEQVVRNACGGGAVARRLAGLHRRLGRLLFWSDELPAARRHLVAAWRLDPGRRPPLRMLAAACLPASAFRALRSIRGALTPRSLGEPRQID